MFSPIIWSLYSKRQTSTSVIATTIFSLIVNLFFKVISPSLLGLKFNRTVETLLGVGLPLVILSVFECYYFFKGSVAYGTRVMEEHIKEQNQIKRMTDGMHEQAKQQNDFGIRVIILASAAVGLGILILGLVSYEQQVVISVGACILVLSLFGIYKIRPAKVIKEVHAPQLNTRTKMQKNMKQPYLMPIWKMIQRRKNV